MYVGVVTSSRFPTTAYPLMFYSYVFWKCSVNLSVHFSLYECVCFQVESYSAIKWEPLSWIKERKKRIETLVHTNSLNYTAVTKLLSFISFTDSHSGRLLRYKEPQWMALRQKSEGCNISLDWNEALRPAERSGRMKPKWSYCLKVRIWRWPCYHQRNQVCFVHTIINLSNSLACTKIMMVYNHKNILQLKEIHFLKIGNSSVPEKMQ